VRRPEREVLELMKTKNLGNPSCAVHRPVMSFFIKLERHDVMRGRMLRRSKSATQTSQRLAWAGGPHVARGSTTHTMSRILRLAAAISLTAILGLMIPARAQQEPAKRPPLQGQNHPPGLPGQHLPGPAAHPGPTPAGLPPAGTPTAWRPARSPRHARRTRLQLPRPGRRPPPDRNLQPARARDLVRRRLASRNAVRPARLLVGGQWRLVFL
jgi:hypothetical protein